MEAHDIILPTATIGISVERPVETQQTIRSVSVCTRRAVSTCIVIAVFAASLTVVVTS